MMDSVNVDMIGIAAVCWFGLLGGVGGCYVVSRTMVTTDLFPDSTPESNARAEAFNATWAPRWAFLWRWMLRGTVALAVVLVLWTLAIWILS
jgi:hypothetical protein